MMTPKSRAARLQSDICMYKWALDQIINDDASVSVLWMFITPQMRALAKEDAIKNLKLLIEQSRKEYRAL